MEKDEIPRNLELNLPPGQSCFLWGARKTGKTSYLKKHFSDSLFIDLLEPTTVMRMIQRPELLREIVASRSSDQKKLTVVIDEVQKAPQLLDIVHMLIESEKIGFVLTGSSARKLKRGAANLLGGRAWRFTLHPLTFNELKDDFDLLTALNRGLLPQHYLSSHAKRFLRSYIADYLNEEIKGEALTRNLPAFAKLLKVIAVSHGEQINYANIASDVGVDAKTVKSYFEILVDTLIGYEILPYTRSGRRDALSRTPKFYLFDVGVATSLQGRTIEALSGAEAGKAFEHWVLMELLAYNSYLEKNLEIAYWRTRTGIEIDFVVGDAVAAFEVKIKDQNRQKDLKGMVAFLEASTLKVGYVITMEPYDRVISVDEKKSIQILGWKSFAVKLWAGELF
jgi:uncharacterized protein